MILEGLDVTAEQFEAMTDWATLEPD